MYTSRAGTARYVRGLLGAIREAAPPSLVLHELAWRVSNIEYRQPWRGLKTLYREFVWAPVCARQTMQRERYDLFHATSHLGVRPPSGTRHVQTLYDLAVLRYPERFRRWHRHTVTRSVRRLERSDRILCISTFTADEAMALLSIPARKLTVVYCGSDLARVQGDIAPFTESNRLPDEYFLFVGSLEPGKNLALLKEVYERADRAGAPLPPLLIVGARWAGVGREGAPPSTWRYLGRQEDAVLVELYRRATALVFPSKYEGFGLPVLEAMSLGCPVICSRCTSLPEVGGDAVVYADLDARSFLGAMRRVRGDDALRRDLCERGRQRAELFSWQRCAAETLAAYEEVLR